MTGPSATHVAVQIVGGLGNQLFQYGTGRALAERLGATLVLDCTPRMANPRKFVLDRFPIKARIIRDAPARVRLRYFRLNGALGRRFSDAFHNVFPRTVQIDGHRFKAVYEKQPFRYERRFEELAGSLYLAGWWQSYRYFEDSAAVRSDLKMTWVPPGANRQWLEQIRKINSVCLHIRRGDYLDPQTRNSFGVCAPSYYLQAAQIIRQRVENPQFFVFSDDLAWCREYLSIDAAQFVDANGPDDSVDELQLMAACRHHIIANSTFSWWAAWLAEHPEQIVIAPQPWFITNMAPDLLPKRWIRLPLGCADPTAPA
jgi:hypothetical protein